MIIGIIKRLYKGTSYLLEGLSNQIYFWNIHSSFWHCETVRDLHVPSLFIVLPTSILTMSKLFRFCQNILYSLVIKLVAKDQMSGDIFTPSFVVPPKTPCLQTNGSPSKSSSCLCHEFSHLYWLLLCIIHLFQVQNISCL